eukprot:TRINITY_DN3704_c0_g2_i1.p1 TRINITY_DN3704_c0_g2~~TRINITY_DN3704_c0_g2_i1.p1  ORF type:complete len:768 (+),score=144.00 TRINITY_DN3704_c0_g2_i1:74-2377(+)
MRAMVRSESYLSEAFDLAIEEVSDLSRRGSQRLVIRERNAFRRLWTVLLSIVLIYTATVFPYRLSFIHFPIPRNDHFIDDGVFSIIDIVVELVFLIDLVINFFFTYRDSRGREVTNFKMIVCQYLRTFFFINLIACLPIGWIVNAFVEEDSGTEGAAFAKVGRIARLQRISRLMQLFRLMRIFHFARLSAFFTMTSVWRLLRDLRSVRILNFLVGLFWTAHMFACGWFLVASWHENVEDTWVGQRVVDSVGTVLSDRPPFEQWLTAVYFILTVFTTVGFGDMNASTPSEILYVMLAMLVGAVVNSIILSEVITIITSVDELARDVSEQKKLISRFAQHTRLSTKLTNSLTDWLDTAKTARYTFDTVQMKDLITSSALPRSLLGELAQKVFRGTLANSSFLKTCQGVSDHVPPRLPLLIAVGSSPRYFDTQEVVYHCFDHAWSLFIVLEGTFANIAKPGPHGGISDLTPLTVSAVQHLARKSQQEHPQRYPPPSFDKAASGKDFLCPYQLFGSGSYFGDIELLEGTTAVPRRSCMRCESVDGGCALILHKLELAKLMEEFPRFAAAWISEARRRESHRLRLLRRLRQAREYKELAASTLQRIMRSIWRRSNKRAWTRPSPGSPPLEAKRQASPNQRSEEKQVKEEKIEKENLLGAKTLELSTIDSQQVSSLAPSPMARSKDDFSSDDVQSLRLEVQELRFAVREEAKERRRLLAAQQALLDVVGDLRDELGSVRTTGRADDAPLQQARSAWSGNIGRSCLGLDQFYRA